MESSLDTHGGPTKCPATEGDRECYLPEGHRFAHSDAEQKPFGEGVKVAPTFTAEQRTHLHDLHRTAVTAWGEAERDPSDGRLWPAAYAADKAFTDALYAIEVKA